jgi:hypothetical protein
MKRVVVAAAALCTLGILSGCASMKPMALSKETQAIDLTQESVAVMTVRVGNTYKTGYQPRLRYVAVRSEEGEKKNTAFQIGELLSRDESETNQFEEAVVSFSLPPGKYQLRTVGVASQSLLTPGSGMVPVFTRFEVKPQQVVYLGRIEAVRRERKDDGELRAGIVIPLIDQAVSGYSGGTFDVVIRDSYEKDVATLRTLYPALQKVQVTKAVLPKWRKPSDEDMN